MVVVNLIREIKDFVKKAKAENKTVGFVPTMGALHKGHISLIEKSTQNNDITISSVFVNPTQFNDANDLKNYSRNFEKDSLQLKDAGCDVLFYPSVEEMYPEEDHRKFDFNGIDNQMEGEHRPGHFNGVAQVVSKLFLAIPATNAYFGLKDFQQLAIVRHLVKQLGLPINIVACDIIREPNGLAMSSRNERLTTDQRDNASIIYSTLTKVLDKKNKLSIDDLKDFVVRSINKSDSFEVEYFEIVNSNTLLPVINKKDEEEVVACIAVWADKVRLIDNIVFNF